MQTAVFTDVRGIVTDVSEMNTALVMETPGTSVMFVKFTEPHPTLMTVIIIIIVVVRT